MPKKRVPAMGAGRTKSRHVAKSAKTAGPAPLTAAESPSVRAAVLAGELPWEEAQARLIAAIQGGRVWHSPEWHALRLRLIKDRCAQCSTAEGPFTLQHFWHPLSIPEASRFLRLEHRRRAHEEYLVQYPLVDATEERQACPRCSSVNIYHREHVTPHWKCNYRSGRRWCGHEFDEPVRLMAPAYKANAAQKQAHWTAFYAEYNSQYGELADSFNVQATVEVLELFERYLSGEGTDTFCRKCAFMWDQKGLRLCHVCRTEWHAHHEPACGVCARGVRYVICGACGKQRHSDAYPTCYHCAEKGITTVPDGDGPPGVPDDNSGFRAPNDEEPVGPPGSELVSSVADLDTTASPRGVVLREAPVRGRQTGPRLPVAQCQPGVRVTHTKFGPGTIEETSDSHGGLAVVRFDDPARGRKTLSLAQAPLALLTVDEECARTSAWRSLVRSSSATICRSVLGDIDAGRVGISVRRVARRALGRRPISLRLPGLPLHRLPRGALQQRVDARDQSPFHRGERRIHLELRRSTMQGGRELSLTAPDPPERLDDLAVSLRRSGLVRVLRPYRLVMEDPVPKVAYGYELPADHRHGDLRRRRERDILHRRPPCEVHGWHGVAVVFLREEAGPKPEREGRHQVAVDLLGAIGPLRQQLTDGPPHGRLGSCVDDQRRVHRQP